MSDPCRESRHCDLYSPQVCETLITSSSRLSFLTRAQYKHRRGERVCHHDRRQISKRSETDVKMISLPVPWRLQLRVCLGFEGLHVDLEQRC